MSGLSASIANYVQYRLAFNISTQFLPFFSKISTTNVNLTKPDCFEKHAFDADLISVHLGTSVD